jgi:EAL domain-containing protein (putative c-di-GMP-specific phosphodiesterase class I)
VAEGAPEHLRVLSCDIEQGYYFSKPLPREEMDTLLDENPRW